MTLTGSLTNENFDELKTAVEEAKKVVIEESRGVRGSVRVLFDLSGFTGTYNVGAMTLMKELSDHNRPYTARTGIYGGPAAARVAAEITLALIGDPTIKMFNTRDEAVVWLKK